MNTIGEKLRARRTELGLSLRDVAEATGVSRGTVQRWESGSISPTAPGALWSCPV